MVMFNRLSGHEERRRQKQHPLRDRVWSIKYDSNRCALDSSELQASQWLCSMRFPIKQTQEH